MPDAVWVAAAFICTAVGMAWLAFAMDVHWKQVHENGAHSLRAARILRALGTLALVTSLVLCLIADTATMAVLVWMMLLAVSAAAIAFALSVNPRWLAVLAWGGGPAKKTDHAAAVRRDGR